MNKVYLGFFVVLIFNSHLSAEGKPDATLTRLGRQYGVDFGNDCDGWRAFTSFLKKDDKKPASVTLTETLRLLEHRRNEKQALMNLAEIAAGKDDRYAAFELLYFIEKMSAEDKARIPRARISKEPARQIEEHIYNLRTLRCEQQSMPGFCSVIDLPPTPTNPAVAIERLYSANRPLVVSSLVELLGDRRPLFCLGHSQDKCVLLRNQDAAIEILEHLIPIRIYYRTHRTNYYSDEGIELRQQVKACYEKLLDAKMDYWVIFASTKHVPMKISCLRLLQRRVRQASNLRKSRGSLRAYTRMLSGTTNRLWKGFWIWDPSAS